MKKGMTQAERLTAQRRAAMYMVMELLAWTEMEYTAYLFKTGCKYLEKYIQDEDQRRQVIASSAYWGWFKLKWFARDQDFITACENSRNLVRWFVEPGGHLREVTEMQPADIAYEANPLRTLKGRNDTYLKINDYRTLSESAEMEDSYCTEFQRMMKTN